MTDRTAEPSVVTDDDVAALSQRALVRRLELAVGEPVDEVDPVDLERH
jgi:hypothetical protein